MLSYRHYSPVYKVRNAHTEFSTNTEFSTEMLMLILWRPDVVKQTLSLNIVLLIPWYDRQ